MRTKEFIRGIALSLAIFTFALLLTTCGGGKQSSVASFQSSDGSGGFQAAENQHRVEPSIQTADGESLYETLAELEELECPEGVDEALFAQLKDALASQLESRLSSRDSIGGNSGLESPDSTIGSATARFVSTPPTGDANQVKDLTVTDNGDGTYTLSWHYRNLGDYNQNGTVDIGDITPVSMHYGETVPEGDDNCIQAVVDGDGSGSIGLGDITPISMNYGVSCAGYTVSQGPTEDGPWDLLAAAPFSYASGEGRLEFALDFVPSPGMIYFSVAPYDGKFNPEVGVRSLPAMLPGEAPEILSVSPLSGAQGRAVSFAAEVTGTPPLGYSWEFQDAVTGVDPYAAKPTGAWESLGTYEYCSLTVANAYGEDTLQFTLTVGLWRTAIVDSTPGVGYYSSLAVVNGNPAVSYYDHSRNRLYYARAEDAEGTAWGNPTMVDYSGGYYTSLATVWDRPAIAYCDNTGWGAKYVRALDADGIDWGSPREVRHGGGLCQYTNLIVAWDKPAVIYHDLLSGNLMFARSQIADGSAWDDPVAIDSEGIVGLHASSAVINGLPVICYTSYPEGELMFIGVLYGGGTTTSYPSGDEITTTPCVSIDISCNAAWASLAEVDGCPVVSYCDRLSGYLKYVRAEDAEGSAWEMPVIVDGTGNVGAYTSLKVIGGVPAIAYYDWGNGDLKFVRARGARGEEWCLPENVSTAGDVGRYASLAVVEGTPAIAYFDQTNARLMYSRYEE